jgi:hypothetical protein
MGHFLASATPQLVNHPDISIYKKGIPEDIIIE